MSTDATTIAALQQELANAREQIAIYEQLLDAVPDMVLYKGPRSRLLYANRAFREHYNMSQEELRGIIDAPFNEPDHTQQYVRDDAQVFNTGEMLFIPSEPVTRHDGVVEYFQTIKYPVYDAEGTIIGTVGVSRNLEKERKMAQTLAEHRARTEHMIANTPGMVYQFLLEPDGTMSFPFVSGGSTGVFGVEPEAIMADAMNAVSIIHPEDLPGFQASVAESAATLEPWTWEGRVIRSGKLGWIQGASRPTRLADGSTLWDGLVMDITERKHNEEMQQRLSEILAATPDYVGMAGPDGIPIYMNPAFRAVLGLGEDADITERPLAVYHPTWVQKLFKQEAFQTAAQKGIWTGETAVLDRHGREIPTFQTILSHTGPDGRPAYFSAILRDLREQKRAEAEQRRLQEEMLRVQATALAEMSTPLIPLTNKIVIMPLIGSIDSMRTQRMIETLLDGIANNRAQVAIIDVTGVPVVDTQVAGTFIRAAQTGRLLGAEIVLTGIRPELAQTLVGLGVNLGEITTHSSLQQGIAFALLRTKELGLMQRS